MQIDLCNLFWNLVDLIITTIIQPITRGIKNCRDSRLFNGCSPLQLLCNLTVYCPQSATFHTANRYASL